MKNATHLLSVLVLACSVACRAEAPSPAPGPVPVSGPGPIPDPVQPPMGRLGHRIGSYLTIEGTRAMHGKVGSRTLLVDTVDGTKLEHPVGMWVDNVSFPAGERCVIKGYETGRWIGTPDEVAEATHQMTQAAWQFQFYFRATSIEAPPTLKLE